MALYILHCQRTANPAAFAELAGTDSPRRRTGTLDPFAGLPVASDNHAGRRVVGAPPVVQPVAELSPIAGPVLRHTCAAALKSPVIEPAFQIAIGREQVSVCQIQPPLSAYLPFDKLSLITISVGECQDAPAVPSTILEAPLVMFVRSTCATFQSQAFALPGVSRQTAPPRGPAKANSLRLLRQWTVDTMLDTASRYLFVITPVASLCASIGPSIATQAIEFIVLELSYKNSPSGHI